MFRKILVATDLTDASLPALRVALDFARRFSAEVVALYVAESAYTNRSWYAPFEPSETELLEALRVRQRDAALVALEAQIEKSSARTASDNILVRPLLRDGVAADIIPSTAVELGADLIVLGTHGRKGASHLLLGSIAERVVRSAACPVLTVRPGET